MGEGQRNLTDADVEALADEMEKRIANRFYGDVGRGVWALAWKALLLGILGIAAYGSFKGLK